MTTATKSINKLNSEVAELKQEVRVIRSLLIGAIGKDEEGQYHPEFVKEILEAAKEKPQYLFRDTQSFLAKLKHV